MGLAFWKNGSTTLPFFEAYPILGSVKSSIPHGSWKYHIFSKKILKLEYTMTFISTTGIFV
jgi:hypothetical protein